MPSASANYVTVSADGSTSAVFPGGVQIDAATGIPPIIPGSTPSHAVTWVRQDGAWIAQVAGYYDQATDTRVARIASQGTGNSANLDLFSGPAGSFAWLEGDTVNAGVPGSSTQRTIIQQGGNSDFVQVSGGVSGTVGTGVNFWGGYVFNTNRPAMNGMLITAQGSGYLPAGTANVNYQLYVDGVFIAQSNFYFNNSGMHMMLPMLTGKTYAPFPAGNHTILFSNPSTSLAVDSNDACAASWIG